MILSTAYFPPVHYFSKLALNKEVIIEIHDHYGKQSYRNRCTLAAANGPLSLSIPIIKGTGNKQEVKDCRIEYVMPWQKLHFKSIESAYRHAPFYEFYIDDILPFFEKKEPFLLDLNTKICELMLEFIGLSCQFHFTEQYAEDPSDDYRELIHPKKDWRSDQHFQPAHYQQVFEEKNGFQPNLSILDTLFCLGPETRLYLKDSIKI